MFSETTIKVAARLYEMRDAAKILLGDNYQEQMRNFGKTLKLLSRRANVSVLEAAKDWATAAARDGSIESGKLAIIIMASAVELMEPSQEVRNA